MPKRLVLLHTVSTLIAPFAQMAAEILPLGDGPQEVELWHVADEMLLKVVLGAGGLTPFAYRRVAEHVVAAEQADASAVQVTCSSISPCVDAARLLVGIPVLKVDEPMVDQAIALGTRIGVVATAPTTLRPTAALVAERANELGKRVTVDAALCEGAYPALLGGDMQAHDQIVRAVLRQVMARNDVVVLAQASMARVADTLPEAERSVPVLTSPRLALERARDVLNTV